MSNETFLISIKQNNDLSLAAESELRLDTELHPLNQRHYTQTAALAGNSRRYSVNQVKTVKGPLYNKKILFLGSSVTFGFGSLGESFVDYLWKKDGVIAIKDAENGTILVDQDTNYHGDSYVSRFKQELAENVTPEILVLQLSTNDAQKQSKLGQISTENFDTQTIAGALQFIIETAKDKWHCPVLLYSNPYFKNDNYSAMVDLAEKLSQIYQIDFLDFYHNPAFKQQSKKYMADLIHPTRAGYLEKWLPEFEKSLIKLETKN